MNGFSVGAPEWSSGFLLLIVLVICFLRNEMLRETLLKKLVAARLMANLTGSMSEVRRRWKFGLGLAGLTCVIFALMQPRYGYDVVTSQMKGIDVMLAVDTSKSMLSEDAQPDRLTRAKFAGEDVIDALEGDRVGLIAFAGTSFVEAPLTVDYSATLAALRDLDTSTIPRGGTNIASAIREAAEAFGKGESAHRALILFTDGEELEDDAVQAAKDMKGQFRIFTVGVGTPEGSLIPAPSADGGGTEFVKDDQGNYVKSKLDEPRLREIANATGGFYVHLESGPATAKAIVEQGLMKMQARDVDAVETRTIERYEWPLALGILLLMSSMLVRERRRVVRMPARVERKETAGAAVAAAAAMALLLLAPARGWSMNEGLNLYNQKDYKGAYDVFQNQLNGNPESAGLEFDRGAAAYKSGDYDKALEAFGKVVGSPDPKLRGQAEYNLGNTLVQHGALQEQKDQKIKEWTGAINHYDQALKADPNDADAKYNEEVVKRMIDELNKKQPPQQQQPQQKNQKNQDSQKDQQNQQQQNQQSQQNQQQQQQSQPSQQQNQQAQNQQNNQNQQSEQNKQNPQGQNQQPQNQQGQNQQNKQDQQNGAQGQQGQNQPDQQNQNGQGQNKPQGGDERKQDEQNQASANQNNNMNGSSPSPTPQNGPGVLKEQTPEEQQKAEDKAAAKAATEDGKTGEMTASQAQALIDSLRGEDEHVSLYDKNQDHQEAPYKDW